MAENNTFRRQLDRWALGLSHSIWEGGAVAVKAFFGVAGVSALGANVQSLNVTQAVAVFGVGAFYHLCDYLERNPLVNLLPETNNQLSPKI